MKKTKKKTNFTLFRYLGPGVLVTVGFIDPGNWAANLAAGSTFGYSLLWMVTLSTIMLILLQHNVAKLGIATGYCLAENTFMKMKPKYAQPILMSAFFASISTALAEILGGAIALDMLLGINIKVGAIALLILVITLTFLTSYKKLEKIIIGFVAIIGFCFFYETTLFDIAWKTASLSAVTPSLPMGSLPIVVSVLGAVVMPHNLFLHSEIVQSRKWFIKSARIKKRLLQFEFLDTLFSMILGWAINCTIILLACEVFFKNNIVVTEISQASDLLQPILGNKAAMTFAIAFLFAGFSSSITAGVAGGTIFSALFKKEHDENSKTTKIGIALTLVFATFVILFITNPLQGLIYSQIILSMQLPITIGLQVYLTSRNDVMGVDKNSLITKSLLIICGIFVSILNIALLISLLK